MQTPETILGDGWLIDAVSRHAESHLGEIAFVIHETNSSTVHVDIHVVTPNAERPYYTLITSGMAQRAMTPPPSFSECRFAELVMSLPPNWRVEQQYWEEDESYWPIGLLQWLGRLPHEGEGWLWRGHSIGVPKKGPTLGSNTRMSDVVLFAPKRIPNDAQHLHVAGRDITLLGVYPVLQQELDFKLDHGSDALNTLFDRAGVSELLDPMRSSVVPTN